jgi:hypothetical protein
MEQPRKSGVALPTRRSPCNHWYSDECEELQARICALQTVMGRARDAVVKSYECECLAGVDGVRDALLDLNLVIVHKSLEAWVVTESPLMAYVSSTFVWCGDVVGDLHELAEHGASRSWETLTLDLADSATAYVAEYLDPLFRRFNELCGSFWTGHALQRVRPYAERLQSEIVSLSWELNRS